MAARGDAIRAKRAKRGDVTHRTRWCRTRGERTTTNWFETIAASRAARPPIPPRRVSIRTIQAKSSIAPLWKFRRVTLPSLAAALLRRPYRKPNGTRGSSRDFGTMAYRRTPDATEEDKKREIEGGRERERERERQARKKGGARREREPVGRTWYRNTGKRIPVVASTAKTESTRWKRKIPYLATEQRRIAVGELGGPRSPRLVAAPTIDEYVTEPVSRATYRVQRVYRARCKFTGRLANSTERRKRAPVDSN